MGGARVDLAGCLDDLARRTERLGERVREVGGSDTEAALAVKLLGTTTAAYLTHVWADTAHPAFVPTVGYYQMYGSPNPDTVYRTAVVDGAGDYRIQGHPGTVPDVSIMPLGRPTGGAVATFAPFELSELELDGDGSFEVVLSGHRPAGAPNWWRLEPDMRSLMLRSVSEEWGRHIEPRLAITRLDADPRRERLSDDLVHSRLASLGAVVDAMVMSGVSRVSGLQAQGIVNELTTVDYSASGGRSEQWYQEGCYALDDGEGLLVEAELAPGCSGFSLSLTDPVFSTIDWAHAQSSLNRHQARVGPDGTLRVVVSASDPRIHNWLDTTGYRFGVLQCRWTGGSAPPTVSCELVTAAELRDDPRLADTLVTPSERARAVRAREVGVQLRSQW